ncbi:MAG: ATP-grasp domain-containing protein [Candidatus Omnitrophota bacterium]|nr:ATP-grasp domain-containing protein [Candidatus Omnitrophota bacterium]MBU1928301.1 ATP-grasp domain-containing protein [Candidatus Omnitrophota bacterium]MBU2035543.1 ATP-grasp domain-containing protein [Candidatus Omnitrophota bacterium]MBU2257883.1 ATP-grasp domain-containing protein [Candidatus Omnitrophota bacterium]
MKTVGLTYDLKTDYEFKENDPPDANAEFDHPSTINVIASAIKSQGFKVKKIGNVDLLMENLDKLDVDIVFNISEGLIGRNRESQVPILLEMRDIPFVGADALSLGVSLDKIMAKKIFMAEGIPTPKFFEVKPGDSLINMDHLKFPLIVKPRFEGSSKGLSEASRVSNPEELKKQVEHIVVTYKQPALVEEFIRGEEFTVALIGNDPVEVMPIVQIKIEGKLNLDDKFYTFGHIKSDALEYVCPDAINEKLKKRIEDLALKTYNAIECRDFGRVDFRVDEKGNVYVLEINPLPSLSSEDVFMVIAKRIGISYDEIIGRILKTAIKRYNFAE